VPSARRACRAERDAPESGACRTGICRQTRKASCAKQSALHVAEEVRHRTYLMGHDLHAAERMSRAWRRAMRANALSCAFHTHPESTRGLRLA
jgi:hypothetical protein